MSDLTPEQEELLKHPLFKKTVIEISGEIIERCIVASFQEMYSLLQTEQRAAQKKNKRWFAWLKD